MASERCDVLIVEDDFFIGDHLRMICEDLGYRVCEVVDTADAAIFRAAADRPRLVLMDVRLKGEKDGIAAAQAIFRQGGTRIVFITGSREPQTVDRIRREDHPADILFKPIIDSQLEEAVQRHLSA